ncbi:hypothetical protein RVM24_10005 [Marinobacter sp. KM021]|uniref:hypothetical protein n=1 Tax=Marinobacter sp. KM021 TaxID=3075616 RepID=UPI003D6A64B2
MIASSGIDISIKSQLKVFVAGVSFVLLGWVIYSFADGLTWQFDDWHNLNKLSEVSSYSGFLDFVYGGNAGPTGRPISLLSFMPDYEHWPSNPWGVVQGNLLWHLMNAMLVFLLFSVLFRQFQEVSASHLILSVFVAGIWALLPIHASGILIPVQRMTLVSAFFSLLTLLSYSHLRCYLAAKNIGMSASIFALSFVIVLGTLLSMFSKENGALTILFVGLIEIVFFRKLPLPCPKWLWRLGVALLLFSAPVYVLYLGVQSLVGQESWRSYTLPERVATQAVILFEYLRQILVPDGSKLGPLQDGHKVYSRSDVIVWVCLVGIVSAIVVSVFAIWKRASWLALMSGFSVLFFLGGHVLESTIIDLELYFEHRNYMPSIGIVVLAVSLAFFGWTRLRGRLVVVVSSIALGAISIIALFQTTSLTGNPALAAEMWYRYHPNSVRAVQTLATSYQRMGFTPAAIRELDSFAEVSEGRNGISAHALVLACDVESSGRIQARYDDVLGNVAAVQRVDTLGMAIPRLSEKVKAGSCPGLEIDDIEKLLKRYLDDNVRLSRTKPIRHYFYYELAQIALHNSDLSKEIDYQILSFKDYPSISHAKAIAARYFQRGEISLAIAWLDEAGLYFGSGYLASLGKKELESMRSALVAIDAQLERRE